MSQRENESSVADHGWQRLKTRCEEYEFEEIGKGSEWVEVDTVKKSLTKVIIQLDKACRKWTGIRAQDTVHELAQLHSKPQDIIIHTDGSLTETEIKVVWVLLPTETA